MTVDVPRGGRVLFIGDSITDAGRNRSTGDDLGCGYAMIPTSVAEFERDYRHVLAAVRQRGDAEIVLVEPFLIPLDDAQHAWREDLGPKADVVRRLAADFDATLVAVNALFQEADVDERIWTNDGVHLTPFGHALLAQQWLRAVTPGPDGPASPTIDS